MGDGKIMVTPANPPRRAGLNSERWVLIKSALSAALDADAADIPACLDDACGGDAELRQEVESLLALKDDPDLELLESAAIHIPAGATDASISHWIGRRIGAYEIVEEIGSGGMGDVYRAVRADDEYRKEVAIKLVRAGSNTDSVVARFRGERQVLAGLDHPNIARLLDGGTTEDGLPYFAMELVEGLPLYEYCDTYKLNTSDRLRLFLEICSAVQYAHRHLIVHRDLKPGNILVTADGRPKLLDFGIAKILDAAPASNESTATMFRFLTPEYASPEQIRGGTITTASDVYSLGRLLYETLTGRRPYRTAGGAPHEIAHAICDTTPEKPSTVVLRSGQVPQPDAESESTPASVSALRDGTPEKLSRRLRGDLDNIILTALRKEPERRYASVEQLAGDIRNHLEHLPVSATRDTIRYRVRKFVARNKTAVAAGVLATAAVLAGTAASLYEAHRARQNELRAERRFNDVRALANSLLFDIHDAIRPLPGSTPARKLIVERALQYLDSLDSESGGDPSLQRELATAYERVGLVQGDYMSNNLGDTAGALHSYEKALPLREKLAALKSAGWQDQLALAHCYSLVANQVRAMGNMPGALQKSQAGIAIAEGLRAAHPEDKQLLVELAHEYETRGMIQEGSWSQAAGLGDTAAARESFHKAVEAEQALIQVDPGDEHSQYMLEVDELNYARSLGNDPAGKREKLQAFQHAVEASNQLYERSPTVEHGISVSVAYNRIGMWYDGELDHPKSLENHQQALKVDEELIAKDPQNVTVKQELAIDYANVGGELGILGRKSESETSLNRSVELLQSLVDASPQNTSVLGLLAAAFVCRADNYQVVKKPNSALSDYEKAGGIYRQLIAKNPNNKTARIRLFGSRVSAARIETELRIADPAADLKAALSDAGPMLSAADAGDSVLYPAAVAYSLLGQIEAHAAQGVDGSAKKPLWESAGHFYEQSLSTLKRLKKPADETALIEFGPLNSAYLSKQINLCRSTLIRTPSEEVTPRN
jgi:eukaryotic-like serine/threonine-protein kinase